MLVATLVLFLLLFAFATLTGADEVFVKVPFLFSEDEKLTQTDLNKAIPPSSALPNNEYFNAPMTRIEYMLTELETHLNNEHRME